MHTEGLSSIDNKQGHQNWMMILHSKHSQAIGVRVHARSVTCKI
jgi:hypothetical protein